jgi:hypothetical protein
MTPLPVLESRPCGDKCACQPKPTVEARVIDAVRSLLPTGKENAKKGRELREQVLTLGVPCDCVRRIGEAIRHLRIEERLHVASGSAGYWLEADLDRLALSLVSHKRRVRASAEAIRVFDPVLADRLTLALDLSTEAAA